MCVCVCRNGLREGVAETEYACYFLGIRVLQPREVLDSGLRPLVLLWIIADAKLKRKLNNRATSKTNPRSPES